MFRGNTETFKFVLPFYASEITKLDITFTQDDTIIISKSLSDCTLEEKSVKVTLTEAETLLFDSNKRVAKAQLRVGIGTTRMASQIITFNVCPILKNGALT